MPTKLRLFKALQNQLATKQNIKDIQLDEDFIPPHKPASQMPYDAILCLDKYFMESDVARNVDPSLDRMIRQDANDEKRQAVEDLLQGVTYEEIIGITENTTNEPGAYLAYISLQTPDWISD